MTLTTLCNFRMFDGLHEDLIDDVAVVIESDRIVEVGRRARAEGQVIDLGGRTLMPGLIDAHVHVYAVELDLTRAMRRPATYAPHHAARFMRHMLDTGFTTVRDVGGGDDGLAAALEDGLLQGPRFFYGGRLLGQTGGHGDWRPGRERDRCEVPCGCAPLDLGMSVVADGADNCVRAVREELRRGAHHIKIMGSGGVASPNDHIDALQYSPEEVTAIVNECTRHGSYVAAHCHPAEAIRRSAELGVRSIEHASLIDSETAKVVEAANAFVVPTMAVAHAFHRDGAAFGLPPASVAKIGEIIERMIAGLEIMREAGLSVGFGTDLLGPLYTRNLTEFELRREAFSAVEILRQATSVNARLLRADGQIGCVAPGAYADLIAVDGNPIEDIGIMSRGAATMPFVMKAGALVRNAC